MKRHLMIVTLAGLSLIALGAGAQDAKPAATAATTAAPAAAPADATAIKGDLKRGESLTYTCRGCHGVTGFKNAYPSYHVPRIGGQSETYLRNALNDYRKNQRSHPTMRAQATSFNEQQIADIAAYLSSLKP